MMQAAQNMMANMKPEDLQRMTQMAANMDPKVMEGMMKNMGGPASGVDPAQAAEQMKNMTPEQLRAGMSQAQNQMSAQRQYMYNAAEMLKNEGNAEVKNQAYAAALKKYEKALDNISGHAGSDISALKVSLLNNVALCHLKTEEYAKAVEASEDALKADPRSFKALFRRGQAREAQGGVREAFSDYRRALALSPGDKAIDREMSRLRGEMKAKGIEEPAETEELPEPAAAPAAAAPAVSPPQMHEAVEMMKNLSPEDLKRLNINSPEEANMMRSAAEQMASNPELTKQMSEMMKNMPPEQMQSMMNMSAKMRGGGLGGNAASSGDVDPAAMLNNPDMMKAAEQMMSSMSPETIAALSKASGMEISEDKARMAAKFLPYMLKLMRLFGYVKQAWSAVWSPRGRVILAVIIVLIAVYQHYRT
uniref:STI1 domain-containing protein n=1 Tax=Zooxanthella nutricula TaxID=1333877 RepID=A0A7S2L8W5_9DINO